MNVSFTPIAMYAEKDSCREPAGQQPAIRPSVDDLRKGGQRSYATGSPVEPMTSSLSKQCSDLITTYVRPGRRCGGISDTLIDEEEDYDEAFRSSCEGPEQGDFLDSDDSPEIESLLAMVAVERSAAAADIVFC